MQEFKQFIDELDQKLSTYFDFYKEHICCHKGCSACCEKGDYPLSELELRFVMLGYESLDSDTKIKVQKNFKTIVKGEACPFLINKECSIYPYRPIVCRTHGLVYLIDEEKVKLPYCVHDGLNFSKLYKNGKIIIKPISENLDTKILLKDFKFGEIRNLFDWLN